VGVEHDVPALETDPSKSFEADGGWISWRARIQRLLLLL